MLTTIDQAKRIAIELGDLKRFTVPITAGNRSKRPAGRPGWSGLSLKALGSRNAYNRLLRAIYRAKGLTAAGKPRKPTPNWTGLSNKELGHAAYMKQWRKLRTEKKLKK